MCWCYVVSQRMLLLYGAWSEHTVGNAVLSFAVALPRCCCEQVLAVVSILLTPMLHLAPLWYMSPLV